VYVILFKTKQYAYVHIQLFNNMRNTQPGSN